MAVKGRAFLFHTNTILYNIGLPENYIKKVIYPINRRSRSFHSLNLKRRIEFLVMEKISKTSLFILDLFLVRLKRTTA